ncbi:MAG: mechanosensitive ion channel family protein, partial [Candidatus Margulisbacteria bacterium]|nr:mechanosensitive ion channel family protein [Candidatus Margulisiibacteriota bacterium]
QDHPGVASVVMTKFAVILSDYRFLAAAVVFLLWAGLGWLLVKGVERLAGRVVKGTANKIDDLILREGQLPLWLLLVIAGFFVVARTVELPANIVPRLERFASLLFVLVVFYFVARLLVSFARLAAERNAGLRSVLPTFSRLGNLVVIGAAAVMFMDLLGISVTPLLASLGIAGLAIGLALQETLGNFFAGVYILLSQPVRVGDYIELDNGLKGYVVNIGWRETRIRTLPNNLVVVPNSKLSQSIITNYYLPGTEMACLIDLGVSYDSDLKKVEAVTVDVAQEVLKRVSGGVGNFEPFIRYHTFADFSINFTVILKVNEFTDQYLVKHEFVKALHERYKREGIQIPFPIRDVNIRKTG